MHRRFVDEVRIVRINRAGERRWIDLAAETRQQAKFSAPGKEFRGSALIAFDMRFLMTKDGARRRTETRQGKRVRRGSGRSEPEVEVFSLERRGNQLAEPGRDRAKIGRAHV